MLLQFERVLPQPYLDGSVVFCLSFALLHNGFLGSFQQLWGVATRVVLSTQQQRPQLGHKRRSRLVKKTGELELHLVWVQLLRIQHVDDHADDDIVPESD